MGKLKILFTLLLILLIPACNPKVVNQLELQIDVNPDYKLGEDIRVTLFLVNNQEESIMVNKRMGLNVGEGYFGEVYFIITSPSGQEVNFFADLDYHHIASSDFTDLEPGESLSHSYELNQYFAPFDEIGKYSIQGIYYNYSQPDDGRTAWTGEIRSDIVHFTVNP
jgi:hypothetical protein